jgi:hypothetical protein
MTYDFTLDDGGISGEGDIYARKELLSKCKDDIEAVRSEVQITTNPLSGALIIEYVFVALLLLLLLTQSESVVNECRGTSHELNECVTE